MIHATFFSLPRRRRCPRCAVLLGLPKCGRPSLAAIILIAAAVAWSGAFTSLLSAGDATPAANTTVKPAPATLIVLQDGRVIDGKITYSDAQGGYFVEQPAGNIVLPSEMVRFTATSMDEAYLQMKKAYPNDTVSNHLSLARWCITWKLYERAAEEIELTRQIDPENHEAGELVLQIKVVTDLAARSAKAIAIVNTPQPASAPVEVEAADTPAGISNELFKDYNVRVQPLLMNKCASAGCHGPQAQNNFRLTHVRGNRGGHRQDIEKNIEAIARYIDAARPANSPLLTVPMNGHGRGGRNLFGGPRDEKSYQMLRDWVTRMARAKAGKAVQSAELPVQPPETDEQGKLKSLLQQAAPDAFDPATFNRKYHPTRAAPIEGCLYFTIASRRARPRQQHHCLMARQYNSVPRSSSSRSIHSSWVCAWATSPGPRTTRCFMAENIVPSVP